MAHKGLPTLALLLSMNALGLQGCGVAEPADGFEVSSSFASSVVRNSLPRTPNLGSETRTTATPAPSTSGFTAGTPVATGTVAYLQPGGGLSPTPIVSPTPRPVATPAVTPTVAQTAGPAPTTSSSTGAVTPIAGQAAPMSDALSASLDCQYMLSYLGWSPNSLNSTELNAGGIMNRDYDLEMQAIGDRAYDSAAMAISFVKRGSPRPGADQNEIRVWGMLIQNSKLALRLRDTATGRDISVPMSAYSSEYSTWYPSGKPTDEQVRFITSNGYDRQTALSVKLTREFFEGNLKNASNTVTADLSCNNQLISSSALDLTALKTQMRAVLVKKSMIPSYDLVYEN